MLLSIETEPPCGPVKVVECLPSWYGSQQVGRVRLHRFIGDAGGATQPPQEVTIQCPTRESANAQRDEGDQVLQAVKFTDKKVNGLHLTLMKTWTGPQL